MDECHCRPSAGAASGGPWKAAGGCCGRAARRRSGVRGRVRASCAGRVCCGCMQQTVGDVDCPRSRRRLPSGGLDVDQRFSRNPRLLPFSRHCLGSVCLLVLCQSREKIVCAPHCGNRSEAFRRSSRRSCSFGHTTGAGKRHCALDAVARRFPPARCCALDAVAPLVPPAVDAVDASPAG